MNEMQREQSQLELLIYLITSARGLSTEPPIYGPLRLSEASLRLCQLMLDTDCTENKKKTLEKLQLCIRQGTEAALTDPDYFLEMLDQASTLLVDYI